MTKSFVLLGGGIDSLATLEYARTVSDVTCLSFSCSSPQSNLAALNIANYYNLPLETRFLGGALGKDYWDSLQTDQHYVPDRNLVFLSIASALGKIVGIEQIYYGAVKGSPWIYDITESFVSRLNLVLDLDMKVSMRVLAPFITSSKSEVINFLLENKSPIHLTYSCYREEPIPCGFCPACEMRTEAFIEAGVEDPCLPV